MEDRSKCSSRLGRRSFLQGSVASVAGMVAGMPLVGCVGTSARSREENPRLQPAVASPSGSKVLLAYFSRPGENYYYGGRTQLEVGNTEVMAGMISRLIVADVFRIEPVDPYSSNYDETVQRNVREQNANARPAIANMLASIDSYDTVLLGSPIWNVRAPMIMSTFAETFDFTGKMVVPFTTHAMSGLGTTARDYAALCPGATIREGLAVQGEQVQEGGPAIEAWLRRIGLLMP